MVQRMLVDGEIAAGVASPRGLFMEQRLPVLCRVHDSEFGKLFRIDLSRIGLHFFSDQLLS